MRNDRGFYVEPWLMFNAPQVKEQLLRNPAKFANEIEDLRKSVSESINYKWANSHHHMKTSRGKIVAFQASNNKDGVSFNMWTTNSESLGGCGMGSGKRAWEIRIKELFARLDLYDAGQAHCSDCQEVMDMKLMGGRYFGGIYCQSCWDNKWKAVEAKETYN